MGQMPVAILLLLTAQASGFQIQQTFVVTLPLTVYQATQQYGGLMTWDINSEYDPKNTSPWAWITGVRNCQTKIVN